MTSTQTAQPKAADHRHGPRTHLFVIATLCWDEGSAPVHVRNMSGQGALIEAAIVPRPGTLVVLKRGSLQVGGRIAWSAGRKAGLAFDASVCVLDWMAKQSNGRQDQIDEIVLALKCAVGGKDQPSSGSIAADRPAIVEAELALLRADLAQLGNILAADVILVATHPEIQSLDIALQRIERIRTALGHSETASR